MSPRRPRPSPFFGSLAEAYLGYVLPALGGVAVSFLCYDVLKFSLVVSAAAAGGFAYMAHHLGRVRVRELTWREAAGTLLRSTLVIGLIPVGFSGGYLAVSWFSNALVGILVGFILAAAAYALARSYLASRHPTPTESTIARGRKMGGLFDELERQHAREKARREARSEATGAAPDDTGR